MTNHRKATRVSKQRGLALVFYRFFLALRRLPCRRRAVRGRSFLSNKRRDQLRPIVGGAVHRGRNLVGLEESLARWHEQRGGGGRIDVLAVEPEVVRLGRHDHRHALVQMGELAVRIRCDDHRRLHQPWESSLMSWGYLE